VNSARQPALYYRRDLALVHHLGFGSLADSCAPGILRLLESVRDRKGLVLELGCGSGALTQHLVAAGHRVMATDASPAMLELAREHAGAHDIRRLTLPDDPIPEADAVVSVGHVLAYLPDESAILRAFAAMARALRPGGLLAIDVCDRSWNAARAHSPPYVRICDDWAIFTEYRAPSPRRFQRRITIFVRNQDGTWRRDDELHENVLIDTAVVSKLLSEHRLDVTVQPSFGTEQLPAGLAVIIARKA
jgi:SAM-dependent methyltransferase